MARNIDVNPSAPMKKKENQTQSIIVNPQYIDALTNKMRSQIDNNNKVQSGNKYQNQVNEEEQDEIIKQRDLLYLM